MSNASRFLCAFLWIGFALPSLQAKPQFTSDVLKVEEDWEMVLGEPDPLQDSPQISTWMSPTSTLENEHFAVDWNHAQRPDFSAGGFQTKAFDGSLLMEDSLSENGDNFVMTGEVVRWTQVMAIHSGQLLFAVKDGTSQSWGSFGGVNTTVRFRNSPVSNLNAYSPTASAEWSGVGYASNRVSSLKIVRVRYFLANGLVVSSDVDLTVQ